MYNRFSLIIIAFFLGIGFCLPTYSGEPRRSLPPDDAPTDYVIIVTGGELLRGVYADGHVHFITRTLGPLGCRCVGSLCVGDLRDDLYDALHYAADKADLIIVTGGLGPTDDDITRKTLSDFTGIALQENPVVMKKMMQRFGVDRKEDLRSNLRIQTHTPLRGTYLPNPNGTAVGLVFDNGRRVVAALPGPPRELQPMVEQQLIPFLSKRFGIHSIGHSITMRFVGIGESNIDHIMHQKMTLPKQLMISSLFELGRVDLTFSLPGSTPKDMETLKSLEDELLHYVGDFFYADNGFSLEECVIDLLNKNQATLATVEVGSGGSIAASLNHADGSEKVYAGGLVSPNDQSMSDLLNIDASAFSQDDASKQKRVERFARAICRRTGSTWGIAVSELMHDNKGSSYVWIAMGTLDKGFEVQRTSMRGHGETGKARLVNRVLDLLRRKLR